MTPQFALDLSMDGIALLTRGDDGLWYRDGAVRLDDPDFNGSIARLRDRCLQRGGDGFASWLIIPDSQLLFTTLERDDRRPEATIRQNLQGRTPYDLDELVFDYIENGDRLEVVVVAQETLSEAESFAIDHGFRPVAHTANPTDGQFRKAPWFGLTTIAKKLTDVDAVIRMDGLFEMASSALAPLPDAIQPEHEDTESLQPLAEAGNPADAAHVAELLAQAKPQAEAETETKEAMPQETTAGPEGEPGKDIAASSDTAPTQAPTVEPETLAKRPTAPMVDRGRAPRTAPSFSTRRNSRVVDDAETDKLERIAPRLTGVTRGAPKPRQAPPNPEAFETAIAKAARMAKESASKVLEPLEPTEEMRSQEAEEEILTRQISSARLRPSRLVTATPIDMPEVATLPQTPSLEDMEPVSSDLAAPKPATESPEDDEFVLDPFLAARANSDHGTGRYGLYAASVLALAFLVGGGWAATKYLTSPEAGQQAAIQTEISAEEEPPAGADLAALLPPPSPQERDQPEIVAPAPVILARTDPAEPEADEALEVDAVTAQIDIANLAPQHTAEANDAPVPEPATLLARAPETPLSRPEPPVQFLADRDGPATPQGDQPAPTPDPASTPETVVASAAPPVEPEPAAAPTTLSLLDTDAQSEAQAAALEALLAAPLDEADRLPPPERVETANADSTPDTADAATLTTVAATANSTNGAEEGGLVPATEDGTVAPGGYRVIAGQPTVTTRPRPGVENVETVAAASGTEAQPDDALDAEEQARRAVLSRIRPTIRPREIVPEQAEEETAEIEAEAPEVTEEEAAALAALRAVRPQPRPANRAPSEADVEAEPEAEAPSEEPDPAVVAAEQAATASLAAARAAAEATEQAEQAAASISRLALPRSERPDSRPRAVERAAARIVERRREAAATPASAPAAAPSRSSETPNIRSAGGSVARAATQRNQIRLNRIALIGTYGSSSSRRALVRMGNGRYVKVEVGDRLDRGRVIAIGDGVVRYQRGGRNLELKMPPV